MINMEWRILQVLTMGTSPQVFGTKDWFCREEQIEVVLLGCLGIIINTRRAISYSNGPDFLKGFFIYLFPEGISLNDDKNERMHLYKFYNGAL